MCAHIKLSICLKLEMAGLANKVFIDVVLTDQVQHLFLYRDCHFSE